MEYYPRKVGLELEKWMNRREIIVIRGPRQVGKTTLMHHLREKYGGKYFTLEDQDILINFEKYPKEFFKHLSGFVFIDEVQYSKQAGKILKLIYDIFPNIKLIVSGSGSFDVKVQVNKYLVGRAVNFELLPLDFEEFIMWKSKDLFQYYKEFKENFLNFLNSKPFKAKPLFESEFNSLFEEYLTFGGFPGIVKENNLEFKIELLRSLTQTYIEKDVFLFYDVRQLSKFRDLMKLLAYSVGNLFEISTFAKSLSMDTRTLWNYISILENTYILKLLNPFFKNLNSELRKQKKLYFLDTGFRNAILNNFNILGEEKGRLIENFIFIQLRNQFKDNELKYWRTKSKAEVDFILKINNEFIPIEVKTLGKSTKSFLSFLKTYKPKRGIIFTEKEFGIKKIENTDVLFLRHWMI